jgi:heat shock protein HspQ
MNDRFLQRSCSPGHYDGMTRISSARFSIGQVVRHREHAFRGLVVDVDARYVGASGAPQPDDRELPFYRVLAMGEDAGFLVYAAERVLEEDPDMPRLEQEEAAQWFSVDAEGHHAPRQTAIH